MKEIILLLASICFYCLIVQGDEVRMMTRETESYNKGEKHNVYVFKVDGKQVAKQEFTNDWSKLLIQTGKIPDGVYKVYLEGGKSIAEYPYRNGRIDGVFRYYERGGKLQMTGLYRNNLAEGVWKYFDASGNVAKEMHYKNGKLDGEMTIIENGYKGKIARKKLFKDGVEVK